MSMFSKLDDVELRFVELESQLSQPGLDSAKLTELIKERGSLVDVVEAYREYKKAIEDRDQLKELLEEKDPEITQMAKEELPGAEKKIIELVDQLQILTLPKDPNDEKNVIIEIRAGTGGDEAALFASDLYRMYSRYAERQGWKVETMSMTPSAAGGFKEVIGLIQGTQVFSRLKFEMGVHRVQRVPATETQGRIHTSACTVAILPEADDIEEVDLNPKDLDISTTRSSGAGGQHVNTTDSAIRIVHIPSGIAVECQAERSQHKNKEQALKVLKARLYEKAQEEQAEAISADRKSQVGSGDRSERIRTYNFPQGRVTDHRINLTLYKLDDVIAGEPDEVIKALMAHHQSEQLKEQLGAPS